jgi:hypothetical protein
VEPNPLLKSGAKPFQKVVKLGINYKNGFGSTFLLRSERWMDLLFLIFFIRFGSATA